MMLPMLTTAFYMTKKSDIMHFPKVAKKKSLFQLMKLSTHNMTGIHWATANLSFREFGTRRPCR